MQKPYKTTLLIYFF